MNKSLVCFAFATMFASAVSAATVVVLPGDPSWSNPPGENSATGSSTITATAPRTGTGSLEMFGDRTRFFGLGDPYSPTSNLGLFSNLTSLTFDWSIAPGSIASLSPDYTPALRLHLWNAAGTQRSELIWEGAYNGTYGNTTQGTWYSSGSADNFWQYVAGVGPTLIYNRSLADWQSIYGQGAYISAVSVGVGSSAGVGYHAFADNVTVTTGRTSTRYNFDVPAPAVPDSGSTALLLGLSMLGLVALRRRLHA